LILVDQEALNAAWSGWQVEWLTGSLDEHVASTGRRATELERPSVPGRVQPPAPLPEDKVLQLIVREILASRQTKEAVARFARDVASQLSQGRGERGGETEFASGFFDVLPASGPEPREARRFVEWVVQAWHVGRSG
jgi:hypothetical protein